MQYTVTHMADDVEEDWLPLWIWKARSKVMKTQYSSIPDR